MKPNSTAGTTASISRSASRFAGFLEARRYVAHDGKPKYLSLYSTETFEVLDSPAYRTALANQTDWSKANIARFKNMIRAVARITISRGTGPRRRARHRPPPPAPATRTGCAPRCGSNSIREQLDGIISMHLIESDPALSKPITDDPSAPNPGAGDWFVLIDGTDVNAVSAAAARITGNAAFKPLVISSGVYSLMWDLAKSDLPTSERRACRTAHAALPHSAHDANAAAQTNESWR